MDFIKMAVVSYTLLFFVFHAITSDDSQMSSIIQEILKEYNIQNNTFEHDDLNYSSINFVDFQGDEKLKLHCEKLQLSHRLFENLIVISKLRTNTTKQFIEMLNDIDEFRSTLYQLLQEETQPLLFDELEFEKFGLEDIPRFDLRGYQSNEYRKASLQLQELKSKVIDWANDIQSEIEKSADLSTAIHKFSKNEDISEVPLKEAVKDSLPNSEDDNEDTYEEKIKNLFSTTTDEKNEESEKTEDENYVNKEMYAQSLLSEETLPRWVPTIKDMEEVRDKYLKWMTLFEESDDTRIKSLKESLIDDGQSIKMFCKTLAEYYNITGIIQECASKSDTECEEIMKKVLEQPHLKKFIEFFTAWGSS